MLIFMKVMFCAHATGVQESSFYDKKRNRDHEVLLEANN